MVRTDAGHSEINPWDEATSHRAMLSMHGRVHSRREDLCCLYTDRQVASNKGLIDTSHTIIPPLSRHPVLMPPLLSTTTVHANSRFAIQTPRTVTLRTTIQSHVFCSYQDVNGTTRSQQSGECHQGRNWSHT